MKRDEAVSFAEEWIRIWNNRDLEAILSHYTEDAQFRSPPGGYGGRVADAQENRRWTPTGAQGWSASRACTSRWTTSSGTKRAQSSWSSMSRTSTTGRCARARPSTSTRPVEVIEGEAMYGIAADNPGANQAIGRTRRRFRGQTYPR